ncbi:MAG: DUF922 domain-containing protein [Mesorhizobium sp.]|nr:MAG: DUF922 domain-containing protein [Mesorhizobium sp.]
MANLVTHENEHVRLYKSAAADLDKRLKSFSSSCRSIRHDARAVDNEGFDRMQKVNDDYDARTDGGRNTRDHAFD